MAFCEKDKVWWEAAPAAHFQSGSSSDQKRRGACRGEGFVLDEDVPDGFGELAGEIDPGDLRAALPAEAPLHPLGAVPIAGVASRVGGASISAQRRYFGPFLASGPRTSRLPDCRTSGHRPGYPASFLLAREPADVADLRGDRVGEDRTDPEGRLGGVGSRGGRRRACGDPPRRRRSPPPADRPSASSCAGSPSRPQAGRTRRAARGRPPRTGLRPTRGDRRSSRSRGSGSSRRSGDGPGEAGSGPARALPGRLGSAAVISGTRSRRASSAKTRASILSVLAASGAMPLTLAASGGCILLGG
jgi:hypothetical protein